MIVWTLRIVCMACWIIYPVYWWISARSVKAVAQKQSARAQIAHKIPLIAALFLLFIQFHPPDPLGLNVIPHTPVFQIAAGLLCVLGVAGAVWSRRTLGGNWSGVVTIKKDHELVKTGPYRFARHPIYTSLLMLVLGTALASGQAAALLAVALVFTAFWIKIVQEERMLTRQFPEEYPAYRAQVKALIPYIF